MSRHEFRVRPVTRYILTHYQEDGRTASSACVGEFDNPKDAERAGAALAQSYEGASFGVVGLEQAAREERMQAMAAQLADNIGRGQQIGAVREDSFPMSARQNNNSSFS